MNTAVLWSENWSAIRGAARTGPRTVGGRHPPRHCWDQWQPRRSLWQLTTRSPRIRSGSQLSVAAGVLICVRAGRTAVGGQERQLVEL
jgi:hypothetical protein